MVPFGGDVAGEVEAFARRARYEAGRPLGPADVGQLLSALCAGIPCPAGAAARLAPLELEVGGGAGAVVVAAGEEPADAARRFLDGALRAGHAVDAQGAEGLMRALCDRK